MDSSPASSSCPPGRWPDGLDQHIAIAPDKQLGVRIYGRHAAEQAGHVPLVVHFHAGAFVTGSLDQGACIARLLAEAGAVVMSVDYPLAPAHPFPQALQAAYAALGWAWKARHKLAGKDAPLFVAGEEAGGNLAAALGMMARDQHSPRLAGQILLSPMLDACMGTASLRDVRAGPVGCTWADGWHQYLARQEDAAHPYAAPGSALRLSDLPRTLLVTAQDDPLRDETRAYAQRLRGAGVAVQQATLAGTTGWPRSYLQAGSATPEWADAVLELFSDFFRAAQPEPARPVVSIF